jgi:oxygen-dependent protoporphyrinogen oxidase
MKRAPRVVVIGGGVTGLATARALLAAARAKSCAIDVVVLEKNARHGGNIITHRQEGFTLDGGPDSWVAAKPHATDLARGLGLGAELMPTIEATRHVYVAHGDALHLLPEGLVLAVPTRVMPIVRTRLFSWPAKLRMAMEPFIPRRKSNDDESIGDFVTRRLGREVNERLASPLLGGIFAGDASQLSIRATFPQFVDIEAKHGSLVRAMRSQRKAQAAAAKGKHGASAFLSLRGGMSTLIDALARDVESAASVRRGASVASITRLDGGNATDERGRYAVDVEGAGPIFADHVVVAAPAHAAARALASLDDTLARELAEIRYASTATAFLALRRSDVAHPLDAVGFIVPRALSRPILAATWVSSKWESRAPGGHVLMRAFFGGAWGEDVLAKDDDALAAIALAELRRFMRIDGAPLFSKVFRFDRSNPQPLVGHGARLDRIRARLARHEHLAAVHVIGSGYDGVGIPDCVRQATRTADDIVRALDAPIDESRLRSAAIS